MADEKTIIDYSFNKEIEVFVHGKSYAINAKFSLLDYKELINAFSRTMNYDIAVASVIHNKIVRAHPEATLPTAEAIVHSDNASLVEFVLFVINSRAELKACYDELSDNLPILQRFFVAYDNCLKLELRRIAEKLASITHAVTEWFDGLQKSFQQTMQNTFLQLDWQNYFQSLGINLDSALEALGAPEISDKEKVASYKKWGKFGWTVIPNAEYDLFCSEPTDVESANKLALKHCSQKNMEVVFSLLQQAKIKKSDLEEAILCYKNRCYKACSLVLCSLIESVLIRRQSASSSKLERRKTGIHAAILLENEIVDMSETINDYLLRALNLMQFLMVLFNDTNNFSSTQKIVNRHFIAHGMNKVPVRKRDCIQLFLLLFNLYSLLEQSREYCDE